MTPILGLMPFQVFHNGQLAMNKGVILPAGHSASERSEESHLMARSFVSQRALTQDDRPRSALTQDDKRKQRTAFICLGLMPFQVFHTGQLAMNKGVILPAGHSASERSEESDLMARSFVSRSALTQDDRPQSALTQDDRPRSALTQDDKRKQRMAFICLVLMPFQVIHTGQLAGQFAGFMDQDR